MNIKRKLLSACLCTAIMINSLMIPNINAAENNAPMQPTYLLTNDLEKPQNVEVPTFGWVVNDSDFNELQTAYQIIVTDAVTGELAWDSDKVVSGEQSYIGCGAVLKEGYPYKWKVRTWDKDGLESPYSEEAEFATGISDSNWNASWISDGTGGADAATGKYNHFWYVRGEGELDGTKTVAKAVGYFSAEQDYSLYINENEIGRGQSFDYASETRYQGWDITDAVKQSQDSLTVGALVRTYGPGQGRAATDAGFIGRVNVYYTDGTSTTIVTDGNWKVSQSVPFSGTSTRNSEGDFVEKYDAQNAQSDFTNTTFDDSSWTNATVLGVNTTEAITAIQPELSKTTNDIVKPVSVTTLADGTTVADFGRVIPARPYITFKNGTAGSTYVIQGGYVLKEDGTIDSSLTKTQSTNMTWEYTQADGEQVYNAWDHLAFRYLSIPACGEEFTADTLAAKLVHTEVPEGMESEITTSNTMLNDVYDLLKYSAIYSIQNCFVDTPTREKGQFLQDSINISEASTATYFEREATRKAMNQFMASADRYWTGENAGRMNSVYPNYDGARDIPDFTVNFPYWVYNYYMATGDKAFVEKAYPYVKNVADYISKHILADTGLVTKLTGGEGNANTYMYGIVDWPASGRFGYDWSGTKEGARTTVNMISKRAFDVTAELAKVIGNTEDSEKYTQSSADIKTAINEKLLTADGIYCDGLDSNNNPVSHKSQHATSYALAFDIAPDDKKTDMAEYISGLGMKQGPMTADILAKGLIASNASAAVLKLFTEPNDYGWANEVKNGYTFTFESWKASSVADSQSHGWGATAAADILEGFAGVTVTKAGASQIEIAPLYTDLTSLDASVQTQRGKVNVAYDRSDLEYNIKITVPANVNADIKLPVIGDGTFVEKNGNAGTFVTENGYQVVNVGSGTYEFLYNGNITILPETVVYDTSIEGIKGSVDTENKVYSYEIGRTEAVSEAGNTITDTSKYIDLTVSLGSNDSTTSSDGISFSGSSVGETNNLEETKRYIMITPKTNGVFTVMASFPEAASNRKHRIFYKDFGGDAVDLSACTKAAGTAIGSDITSSAEVTKELNVIAGHTYVLYTYQRAGNISAMSFKYNAEPSDDPIVIPTSSPTPSPSPTPVPFDGIKGNDDKDNKMYSYEIGLTETVTASGVELENTSDYIDLKVGLGNGDFTNSSVGINFTDSSVKEPPTNVSESNRYIIITPKVDGVFSLNINFPNATSNTKCRIFCVDFGSEAVDLSACTKETGIIIGDSITSSSTATRELEVVAGHTYVLYTYQKTSMINDMSFKYNMGTDTESTPSPTELPTPTPTVGNTPEPTIEATSIPIETSAPETTAIPEGKDELLNNFSFEEEVTYDGEWHFPQVGVWYGEYSGSIERTADESVSGGYSVKLKTAGLGQRVQLDSGVKYVLTAYIKGSGSVGMGIYSANESWPIGTSNLITGGTYTADEEWKQITLDIIPDSTGEYVIYLDNYSSSETMYVDDVSLNVVDNYMFISSASFDIEDKLSYEVKYSTTAENVNLYIALYDSEGILMAVKTNAKDSFEAVPQKGEYEIKAFLWDGMKPITERCVKKCKTLGAQEGVGFADSAKVMLASDEMFAQSEEVGLNYIKSINVDRLLAPSYEMHGLDTPNNAERYSGWERKGANNWIDSGGTETYTLAGHSLGHWMSAAAVFARDTGDAEILEKLNYAVDKLFELQETTGSGYIGGCDEATFTKAFSGSTSWNSGYWVPWYGIHKIYQGLLDAYMYTENDKAFDVLTKFCDWAVDGTSKLTDSQMQKMLDVEYGGMNEIFALMYEFTGDKEYLETARRFTHDKILNPLIQGKDSLTGLHANTQIPKIVGAAELYEQDSEKYADYRIASETFWDFVVNNRSYAIGGNSIAEHFEGQGLENLGEKTCESCNTYNMLRLTEHLFAWDHNSEYMDYYEDALYNHILGQQDPQTGAKMYFVSLLQGHHRVYEEIEESWWCCTGTGMENPGRYTRCIYYEDMNDLYVNLYIPNTYVWEEKGLTFKMETSYPYSDKVTLTVIDGSASAAVKFRAPKWLDEDMIAYVDGEEYTHSGGGYLSIDRAWNTGDVIEITIPMSVRVYESRDAEKIAYKYGPVALGADLGSVEGVSGVYEYISNETRIDTKTADVPQLVLDDDATNAVSLADRDTLTFTIAADKNSSGETVTLKPFYELHHCFYNVYWNTVSSDEDNLQKELNNVTLDKVQPDGQQDEIGHNMLTNTSGEIHQGSFTANGTTYMYRDAWGSVDDNSMELPYFSYNMLVSEGQNYLYVGYWGSDSPFTSAGINYTREFDILVDGEKIAETTINNNKPNEVYSIFYEIPVALTERKENVTVKLQAKTDTGCACMLEMRTTSGVIEELQ